MIEKAWNWFLYDFLGVPIAIFGVIYFIVRYGFDDAPVEAQKVYERLKRYVEEGGGR